MKKLHRLPYKYSKKLANKSCFFSYLYIPPIQEISRHQLQMISLEDKITADNPIRFIDAFDIPDNWQVYSTTKKQTSLKSA